MDCRLHGAVYDLDPAGCSDITFCLDRPGWSYRANESLSTVGTPRWTRDHSIQVREPLGSLLLQYIVSFEHSTLIRTSALAFSLTSRLPTQQTPTWHVSATVAAFKNLITSSEGIEIFTSSLYRVSFSLFLFYEFQEKLQAHSMRVSLATLRLPTSSQRLAIELRQSRLQLSPRQTRSRSLGICEASRVQRAFWGTDKVMKDHDQDVREAL